MSFTDGYLQVSIPSVVRPNSPAPSLAPKKGEKKTQHCSQVFLHFKLDVFFQVHMYFLVDGIISEGDLFTISSRANLVVEYGY